MKKEKIFTSTIWYDPLLARVTGNREISAEERKRAIQDVIDKFYDGKCPEDWLDAIKKYQ